MSNGALPAHLDPRSPRHRGWAGRKAVIGLLAFISVIVLLVSVGGWAQYTWANSIVHYVSLNVGGDRPSETFGVQNYLLVGTDSRAGTGDEYGGSAVVGERSDSTILIHVAKDGSTTMVSFPRDTLVTIPTYEVNGKTHAAHQGKFNEAISDGGPSLLIQLVETLTTMRVDHYVSVDLEGFKQITNALGGVDVCVVRSSFRERVDEDGGKISTNTNDPMSGWVGGPGTIHVNGEQALAFVRQRHGLPNSDLDRIKRQQQFIGAVVRKASTSDILTNPAKLLSLESAAASALTFDDNTSIADLKDLALGMKGLGTGSMHVETLPTHAPTRAENAVDNKGDIMLYGVRTSVQIFNPIDLAKIVVPLGGRVDGVSAEDLAAASAAATPDPGATPGPVTIPAAQVKVAVYNGSTVPGLAASAAEALTGKGFQATSAGNAASRDYATSRVIYGAGEQQAAWTVQAAVPGSVARADSTVTGIHLLLGANYSSVVTPTMASAAHTGAAPTPKPTTQAAPPPPNCTY